MSSTFESTSVVGVQKADTIVLTPADGGVPCQIPMTVLPALIDYLQTILNVDRRRAFRIPVTEADLQVSVKRKGTEIPVIPIDLSSIGIGLHSINEQPDLSVDEEVQVSLSHKSHQIVVTGLIKRSTDSEIGIEFPSFLKLNEPAPSEPMRALVASLEMCYIRNRNKNA